jgi:hypothetical protein
MLAMTRRSLILGLVVILTAGALLAYVLPVHQGLAGPRALEHEHEQIVQRGARSCGVERWFVKTGMDADARLVNLNASTSTNIIHLRSISAPNQPPIMSRVRPVETTVWTIQGILLRYKIEQDSDVHLVLSDAGGRTMIAEIPAPQCVGSRSIFRPAIASTRRGFDARWHPTVFWQRVHMPVTVTGVGFFDFKHGQSGVAPNAIELHPVTSIAYAGAVPPPPGPAPTQAPVAKGKVQVSARVSNTSPAPYSTVTVSGRITVGGRGVGGVTMTTMWHYKSRSVGCTATTDAGGNASCSRNIGRATRGASVPIDVNFAYGGSTFSTRTSFTPA